jgi:sodium transport system permease protein
MLDRILVVFQKEALDNFRDRRTITGALIGTLVGPLIILLIIVILGQAFYRDESEQPLHLPVAGAENAPALIQFLEQQGAVIQPAPADPTAAVRNGDAEVVLIIPDTYGADFGAGRPASVQLVLDTSRQSAARTIGRAQALLDRYSQQMAALRLLARGVSPAVIQPLAIERVNVATPQSQVLIFLGSLPYFLMFTIFMGSAGLIVDATAGERERNSLEPLLINPVTRRDFVLGKWLAALPFAMATLLITLGAYALIFNVVPLEELVGLRFRIDLAALAGIFLISLPIMALAASAQMIIATFARNHKEAQNYVNFLPLIAALPGLGLAFLPVKPELWTMLIPTFGQQIMINQFMRGEPVSVINVAVSALVTLALAAALVLVAIRLYEREQILFSK